MKPKVKSVRAALSAAVLAGTMMAAVPEAARADGVCGYVRSSEIGVRPSTCAESLTFYANDGRQYQLLHGTTFRVDYVESNVVCGYVAVVDRGGCVTNGWFH